MNEGITRYPAPEPKVVPTRKKRRGDHSKMRKIASIMDEETGIIVIKFVLIFDFSSLFDASKFHTMRSKATRATTTSSHRTPEIER